MHSGAALCHSFTAWLPCADHTEAIASTRVLCQTMLCSPDDSTDESGCAQVAAYKDESGVIQRRSAICPHMLCAVEWNPAGGL